jgi:hypothetical protein
LLIPVVDVPAEPAPPPPAEEYGRIDPEIPSPPTFPWPETLPPPVLTDGSPHPEPPPPDPPELPLP